MRRLQGVKGARLQRVATLGTPAQQRITRHGNQKLEHGVKTRQPSRQPKAAALLLEGCRVWILDRTEPHNAT